MNFRKLLSLFLWEGINPFLLRLRSKKKRDFPLFFNGLNIGCGIDNPSNWIGIDGGITHLLIKKSPRFLGRIFFRKFTMSKNFNFNEYYRRLKKIKLIHFDLKNGIPYRDNSIPNIFSSHFIEHLTENEAVFLFKECYRTIKNGGIIRICVPSLESEVKKIEEAIYNYKNNDIKPIQKYLTSIENKYKGPYSYHKKMYDFIEMKKILERSKFTRIRQCEFKNGCIPDVELLDTREGLFVEGFK